MVLVGVPPAPPVVFGVFGGVLFLSSQPTAAPRMAAKTARHRSFFIVNNPFVAGWVERHYASVGADSRPSDYLSLFLSLSPGSPGPPSLPLPFSGTVTVFVSVFVIV